MSGNPCADNDATGQVPEGGVHEQEHASQNAESNAAGPVTNPGVPDEVQTIQGSEGTATGPVPEPEVQGVIAGLRPALRAKIDAALLEKYGSADAIPVAEREALYAEQIRQWKQRPFPI